MDVWPESEWITSEHDVRLERFKPPTLKPSAAARAHLSAPGVIVEGDKAITALLGTSADVLSVLLASSTPECLLDAVRRRWPSPEQLRREVNVCPLEMLSTLRPGLHKASNALVLVRARKHDSLATWCEEEPAVNDTTLPLRLLVLDGLTDAANVGTLLRLGVAFGVSAVVYSPDCCDPYHERSLRAAFGYGFAVPVICSDLAAILAELRAKAVWSMAAIVQDGASYLDEIEIVSHRWAVVVGAEHGGIHPDVRDASSALVKIRMAPTVDSFNVATAAGVLLHGCLEREAARAS